MGYIIFEQIMTPRKSKKSEGKEWEKWEGTRKERIEGVVDRCQVKGRRDGNGKEGKSGKVEMARSFLSILLIPSPEISKYTS